MSTKSSTVKIGGRSYITTDELAQRLGVSEDYLALAEARVTTSVRQDRSRAALPGGSADRVVGELGERLIKEKPAEFQSRRA